MAHTERKSGFIGDTQSLLEMRRRHSRGMWVLCDGAVWGTGCLNCEDSSELQREVKQRGQKVGFTAGWGVPKFLPQHTLNKTLNHLSLSLALATLLSG